MSERLEACGKIFLAGEYAVLEPGRPALVAGIDRKLHARVEPGGRGLRLVHAPSGLLWDGGHPPPELRFAARAAQLASKLFGDQPSARIVFEDDFSLGGEKLGLGGSAAASVLAVRAVCSAADRVLDGDATVALALAAHWAEQGGEGSGADVAAAALGGVLEVRSLIRWRSPQEVLEMSAEAIAGSRPLRIRRVPLAAQVRFSLAYTGKSADTRALVRAVRAFAAGDPAAWARRAAEISGTAEKLRDALASDDPEPALDAIRRGAAAMAALGEAAAVPIVTADLSRACALASGAGAAGKPSGAGGGDCAVILAFGDDARARAEAALRPHFSVFSITPA
jgi:phosphomevalonate kinase